MGETNYEEQETQINIDYAGGVISIYTSIRMTFNKIKAKLGEPSDTYYLKKKISGATWKIPFSEKRKITTVLSRPLLIGSVK